ncbi:MAG: TonB-dependent receptor, partial [Gammaproteobacteria bacterium]|nr:TonB-dependent receptor [Gammaproteobacteria bacterium]
PATGTPGAGDCLYFNPFGTALTGSGTQNPPELLNDMLGFMSFDARAELLTIEGFVSRQLGELPGGTAAIAIGAQHRGEEIEYDYDENANRDNFLFLIGNPDFRNDRNVNAVFAELALPLTETVNLQLAGRFEDYGDVDSTDPKATLLWRPTDALSVRASVGTSFRAPSLFQSFGTQTTLTELIDPAVGTPQFFPVRSQPNPSGDPLQPEESDVLDLGVSWFATDNLQLSLDYWSFDYSSVIIEQSAQAILNAAAGGDAAAAAQVVRDPQSGLLLRVDSYYANASSLETDGVDFSVAYDVPVAGASRYRVGLQSTLVASYDIVDPQAGSVDGAGRRNFANFATSVPELRANAFFNWERNSHAVNLFVRYIDSYVDDEVDLGQGSGAFSEIDSQVTADVQYRYSFENEFGPVLTFGVINLTDEDPPHVATNGGYDSKVHDPRGRIWYAQAGLRF